MLEYEIEHDDHLHGGRRDGNRIAVPAERDGRRILVDCGLFQGLKQLRLRNWAAFPVEPRTIDAVCLTHAHLDHSGYLPALVRDGFAGKVYASHATMDLCGILLRDSGFLQEKDADYAPTATVSRSTSLPCRSIR
jgi:metallo-beta-lactamase family protein